MGGRLTGRRARFVGALAVAAVVAGIAVSVAAALRFSDTPCLEQGPLRICPSGVVGSSYSMTFTGEGGCGPTLPYQYRILNGALPAGLTLSSSGVISGTPLAAGTASFWVELSDENPPSASWCVSPATAEREFRLTVLAGLSIDSKSVKPGTIGEAYSETLAASLITSVSPPAGTPASGVTWSVSSGTLPPGVALGSNGVLSGSPTTEGSYVFVVRAQRDANQIDTETLTIVVRTPVVIQPPASVPPSEVGIPLQIALSATGGTGTYTWTLSSGALPPGVALAADGSISGTPQAGGSFPYTASATDSEGRVATYTGLVTVAHRLTISTLRLKAAKVGRLYKAKVATLGGVLPKKTKVRGKLPRGIRFDHALGVFTGTPRKAGRYRVIVEVTDALKVKSTKTFILVVLP